MPVLTAEPRCEERAASDEIVVCGRTERDSPYRIDPQFRARPGPIEDGSMSPAARTRDLNAIGRFDGQMVGTGGYLQQSLQRDCAWRVERQIAQGRQPDCTRRSQPDSPTDWQRR